MQIQRQLDEAILDYSRGEFERAAAKLTDLLAQDAGCFDAQFALGMAHFQRGDFASAIVAGHRAEQMKPDEPLVHTNLSLFYLKAGNIAKAEHHGLQARIAGWRAENAAAGAAEKSDPAAPLPKARVKVIRMPD
jgi:Flp pilus assembly protein TadD